MPRRNLGQSAGGSTPTSGADQFHHAVRLARQVARTSKREAARQLGFGTAGASPSLRVVALHVAQGSGWPVSVLVTVWAELAAITATGRVAA